VRGRCESKRGPAQHLVRLGEKGQRHAWPSPSHALRVVPGPLGRQPRRSTEPSSRKRGTLVSRLLLAVSVIVATSVVVASPALAQSGPSCAALQVLSFHGTNEIGTDQPDLNYLGMGETVFKTWTELVKHGSVPGGMSVEAARYPTIHLPLDAWGGYQYVQAVGQAADQVVIQVSDLSTACPNSRFVFVGYSLGAWVAHLALQKLDAKSFDLAGKIAAIAFMGDPAFGSDSSAAPRQGILRAIGAFSNGEPYVPAGLSPRTLSLCLSYNLTPPTVSDPRVAYDPVCLITGPPILKDVDLQNCMNPDTSKPTLCPHTSYVLADAPARVADWLSGFLHLQPSAR